MNKALSIFVLTAVAVVVLLFIFVWSLTDSQSHKVASQTVSTHQTASIDQNSAEFQKKKESFLNKMVFISSGKINGSALRSEYVDFKEYLAENQKLMLCIGFTDEDIQRTMLDCISSLDPMSVDDYQVPELKNLKFAIDSIWSGYFLENATVDMSNERVVAIQEALRWINRTRWDALSKL